MTCQSCTNRLTSCFQIPSYRTLTRIAGACVSVLGAGISGYLGKRVYETSLEVLAKQIPCPGLELTCMTIVAINAGYVTLKAGRISLGLSTPERVTPRHLQPTKEIQEISAFHPGEGVRRSERLADKETAS